MKRILIVLLIFASITTFAWSQQENNYVGPQFVVWVDSDMWNHLPYEGDKFITSKISKGEMVYVSIDTKDIDTYYGRDFLTFINYNDGLYIIPANNLRPLTEIYLPEDWITKGDAPKKWVMSYYLDVLRSQNRDTFMNYEKTWIDLEIDRIKYEEEYPDNINWYDAWIELESLIINHSGIIIGGFDQGSLCITGIVQIKDGFKLTLTGSRTYAGAIRRNLIQLPKYSERQFFDLLFIPDGDYMDVYIDSLDNKYASFAKVDTPTFLELESLLRTNKCDLSKVQWPTRGNANIATPLSLTPVIAEKIQQPAESDETAAADTAAETQSDTEKSSMPLWVWFAIGAVVIAGGVVAVLKQKK
jgi:hypothetical protein